MSEEPPDDPTDRDSGASASDPGGHDDVEDPFAELADAEPDVEVEVEVEDPFAELDASSGRDTADPGGVEPIDPDGEQPTAGASAPDAGENLFGELDVPDAPPEEDFFEEMETADLDEEAVWEAVFEDPGVDSDPGEKDQAGADAVVRKEQYCKKCEHFSEPPELACNNPGTDIVEVVGVDEFRVRNCPVVADRRRADTVFPDEG